MLQIGDGGTSGSILGKVAVGGILAFDRSDTYTFAGPISDDGANAGQVVQQGTGVLELTGTNTYSAVRFSTTAWSRSRATTTSATLRAG